MSKLYWWTHYGRYMPGEGILPHMGEVISEYRQRRGFKTQTEFAIAVGVLPRTITDWETRAVLKNVDRRVMLARLLKIPPALLGLDWRLVHFTENTGSLVTPPEHTEDVWLEDSYYHYEDTLMIAWNVSESANRSGMEDHFERRLQRLIGVVQNVTGPNKEAWLDLLCRYYQTSLGFIMHSSMDEAHRQLALSRGNAAVQIAQEIHEQGLLAASLFRLADVYRSYGDYAPGRDLAQRALLYADQVQAPTRGNLYLIAADTTSRFCAQDPSLIGDVRAWQDKALSLVPKNSSETDRNLCKLNRTALHHERAKALLQFAQARPGDRDVLRDAHDEMKMAWETLTPDLAGWQMYFFNTEARLLLVENDLEGSSRMGLDALRASRGDHSQKGEIQVRELFTLLKKRDEKNPYICNLGVELGIF